MSHNVTCLSPEEMKKILIKRADRLREIIDILFAWQLIEWHDKNYLPFDNCERAKERLKLLEEARQLNFEFVTKEKEQWLK